MSFRIFQNEKTPSQAIKTRSSKSPKIGIFQKALTHGFGPKVPIFTTFFLGNIRQKHIFHDILNGENAFLGYKKKKFKNPKSDIFRKGLTHGVGLKMAIFPTFFRLVIEARKMSFTILQNKKTPFQDIKTSSSKSRKIDISPKGLTHGFGPKMTIFQPFFLGSIGQENIFYDILEQKNAFLDYKNKKFKKSKN